MLVSLTLYRIGIYFPMLDRSAETEDMDDFRRVAFRRKPHGSNGSSPESSDCPEKEGKNGCFQSKNTDEEACVGVKIEHAEALRRSPLEHASSTTSVRVSRKLPGGKSPIEKSRGCQWKRLGLQARTTAQTTSASKARALREPDDGARLPPTGTGVRGESPP
ncbi:hypothetical protein DPEC_G00163650 [Dallia pectoralis]|uniref:Uncharacterized protein n=1 Tax=Dallia pectoralis TaxID=75939 RepID=A0ACC2GHH0_DALPE|nr:hypothetical protein DPEC_G00163650 [Dallia pectoralis]